MHITLSKGFPTIPKVKERRGLRELNKFVLVIFISLMVTYSVKQSGGKVKYKSM